VIRALEAFSEMVVLNSGIARSEGLTDEQWALVEPCTSRLWVDCAKSILEIVLIKPYEKPKTYSVSTDGYTYPYRVSFPRFKAYGQYRI